MAVSTIKSDFRSSATVVADLCSAKRVGNVIEVWGGSGGSQTISNTYTTIATLPEVYRPSHPVRGTGNSMGGSANVLAHISESGAVQLYATGQTSYWEYDLTFLAD